MGEHRNRKTEKEQMENYHPFKNMTSAALLRSFTVRGICGCNHISSSTYELVCISDDKNNMILTNNVGKILHQVEDFYSNTNSGYGLQTVNNMSENIHVDSFYNIKKITI